MSSNARRPVIFGEVLFDHFPDDARVLGGAPFNAAWHLQAFGLAPLFVSRVGNDPPGREARQAMSDWGMDLTGVQVDDSRPTGAVEITIKGDEPSFHILPHQAYDFIDDAAQPEPGDCRLLYHGSLALRDHASRHALEALRETLSVPVFMDVNLRPPWWDLATLTSLTEAATWVKLNEDELDSLVPEEADLEARAAELQARCALELLVVTRGADGATARTPEGTVLSARPSAQVQVVDTVGAGDAFTSVLLLGLTLGWDTQLTLNRAQSFASAIVGVRGATVANRALYESFRADWGIS